jgi:iron complex outermembrane receptor protein
MRGKLSLSTSVLALICCSAVHAQTASTPTQTSASNNNGGVETVVVTAERRTTDLQKTAISATVLSGDALQNKGVNVVDQLQFIAPNITIDNFGQGIDFDIRGIGKGEHNSQTTPGVITYRDGVATFPGYFAEEPYFDVANIQVLRGPQGTFAGQNAIGGAVFVNTQNPIIGGDYDGYVQAQAGNYTDFGLQGATNIPINDELAARVAFYGETRSSFYDMTTSTGAKYPGNPGDAHWGAGRISLLWKPTNKLTVLFKTDVDYLDNGAYPADPYTDRFKYLPGTNTPNPFYTSLFKISANDTDQMAEDQFVRSSLKVDYVFDGGITLQTVTAYQTGNTAYKGDLYSTGPGNAAVPGCAAYANVFTTTGPCSSDVAAFVDNVDETIWSQEINLISPDTTDFRWILGAFAQSDRYGFLAPATKNFVINLNTTVPAILSPFYQYDLSGSNPESDVSVFGQASYELPAGFEVQLGGRYSAVSTVNQNLLILQYGTTIGPNTQGLSSHNFSYKAALNWTVDENNFLYGFIATGFKPGGLNLPFAAGSSVSPFGPETVINYETGWKSSFFDHHLLTQVDGFYNNFKDFQVIIGYPAFPTFGFEVNDPNPTKLYGFEGSAQAVFGSLSFDANIGLTHSSLGTFYATDPRIASATPCNTATGPSSASCINLSGHAQTYAPDFTFNFGLQYEFKLEGEDTLTPRLNFAHVSGQWATLLENAALGDRLAARDILNAQLAWTHGEYVVTLYATNLTNDQYVAALNSNLDFAGAPRQYGIRLMKAF